MRQEKQLRHEFVEYMPESEHMEEQTLYISMQFATVIHKCCCGCDKEVVTPISPTDWKLIFDGETISLDPSIGNWSFECRSHYWIRDSKVKWAQKWSCEEIAEGRDHDQFAKERYFDLTSTIINGETKETKALSNGVKSEPSLRLKFKKWWSQLRKR
jgi:Family of unknown function (DUF6527)